MTARNENKKSPYFDVNGIQILEGDMVKGVGQHVGQSEALFINDVWQPFSYLDDYNGANYEIIDICPECEGSGSYEGKTGGSEGIPEADVEFVCSECKGTGKFK